jgi:hypothetical protein
MKTPLFCLGNLARQASAYCCMRSDATPEEKFDDSAYCLDAIPLIPTGHRVNWDSSGMSSQLALAKTDILVRGA